MWIRPGRGLVFSSLLLLILSSTATALPAPDAAPEDPAVCIAEGGTVYCGSSINDVCVKYALSESPKCRNVEKRGTTKPPTCSADGMACNSNSPGRCCSGICPPNTNGKPPVCVRCLDNSSPCQPDHPQHCCSGLCPKLGTNPARCVSCIPVAATCKPDRPQDCCSGFCRSTNDGTPATCISCLPIAARCSQAKDCCSGSCTASLSGLLFCTPPSCIPSGQTCNISEPGSCCTLCCRSALPIVGPPYVCC